jgi:hypothetical protein
VKEVTKIEDLSLLRCYAMTTDKKLLASRSGCRWDKNTDSDRKGIVKNDEKQVRVREDRGL